MKYICDHDLHIHSNLSRCCPDKGLDKDRILLYAKNRGLKTVVITDHFWDGKVPYPSNDTYYAYETYEHICEAKPLPQSDGISFLFGCETDMATDYRIGISKERMDEFDFVIIPTTHMHFTGLTISQEDAKSLDRRRELWYERLDALLSMDLPFHKIGIPHLACPLIVPGDRRAYLELLDSLDEKRMKVLFGKAAKLGVGIEINASDFSVSDPSEYETVARMFRIAKKEGCRFYLGSDCHNSALFGIISKTFQTAVELVGLKESDKFTIS